MIFANPDSLCIVTIAFIVHSWPLHWLCIDDHCIHCALMTIAFIVHWWPLHSLCIDDHCIHWWPLHSLCIDDLYIECALASALLCIGPLIVMHDYWPVLLFSSYVFASLSVSLSVFLCIPVCCQSSIFVSVCFPSCLTVWLFACPSTGLYDGSTLRQSVLAFCCGTCFTCLILILAQGPRLFSPSEVKEVKLNWQPASIHNTLSSSFGVWNESVPLLLVLLCSHLLKVNINNVFHWN